MGSILGEGRCVIISTSSVVLSRTVSGLRFYPSYKLTRQLFFSLTATFSKGRGHETPGSEIIFFFVRAKVFATAPCPRVAQGNEAHGPGWVLVHECAALQERDAELDEPATFTVSGRKPSFCLMGGVTSSH